MAKKYNNEICIDCLNNGMCETSCSAVKMLIKLNEKQKVKDKTARLRNIARQLKLQDAEVNNELRLLAEKIIKKFGEFSFIKEYDIKIGYVNSYESKGGEKIVYADCRKLQEVYKAYLPFDYIITFYDRNTGSLNENQKKILMLHELKHIGIGPSGLKIIQHDIEDFSDILTEFGLNWNGFDKEVRDILEGD
jgi:DNA-binding Lrp family transcriptional regulator